MDIAKVFDRVAEGFGKYMGTSGNRSFHCPVKVVNTLREEEGVSVERRSYLYGYFDGVYGMKTIYVNDLTGDYFESIAIQEGSKTHFLENAGVTTYRCGLMTCLAISKFKKEFESVGFIGTGRTNIMNCKAITEIFGQKRVVIRGSARNREKNAEEFTKICGQVYIDDTDDLSIINGCDIVVVCTSSYKKEDLISTEQLSEPGLIVALDSGYLLDESFRGECNSFTDYVEQINAYYDEEFPYDSHRYLLRQISDECRSIPGRSVVYLHGIGLADIIVAKELIKE